MTEDEMLAEIARLEAENAKLVNKNDELTDDLHLKLTKAFEETPEAFQVINAEDLES
jgi:plasmid maintenance system antidote protein VapI